ncbi:mitochondrial carrier [Westerdykella ornata]|uniref:Mitochondrial carrier n=1 Tax=Westerdykella ornata TaxID=318751 RepID=A0A6A6JJM2_WESOR|nr:mitochondrial carrier [Westerdykella ornata]KAF2276188.1 mitochondrial carrier [Westerdykella ornata]
MLAGRELQDGRAWVESPYLRSLIAGGLAGTTVDLSLFPLDTLKTRLQSSAGFTASGGFTGIYRGVGSALIGSAPGAALFFITYDSIKRALLPPAAADALATTSTTLTLTDTTITEGRIAYNVEGKPYTEHTRAADMGEKGRAAAVHMLAASAGEIAACAVRVPTEVVKQRAQAIQHPSSLSALVHILSHRGTHGYLHVWRELYRGWGITVMREVPFTVIQFPLWESLKQWRLRSTGRLGPGHDVSGLEGGVLGSLAGAVAAGITTPLDVLKTRMMLARERVAMLTMLRTILRESGPQAFFKGLGPRVGWISAGGAIFLGSYQWVSNVLGGVVV